MATSSGSSVQFPDSSDIRMRFYSNGYKGDPFKGKEVILSNGQVALDGPMKKSTPAKKKAPAKKKPTKKKATKKQAPKKTTVKKRQVRRIPYPLFEQM